MCLLTLVKHTKMAFALLFCTVFYFSIIFNLNNLFIMKNKPYKIQCTVNIIVIETSFENK